MSPGSLCPTRPTTSAVYTHEEKGGNRFGGFACHPDVGCAFAAMKDNAAISIFDPSNMTRPALASVTWSPGAVGEYVQALAWAQRDAVRAFGLVP